MQLDDMSPEQHRARYEALKASAKARASAPPPAGNADAFSAELILRSETIPAGWYFTTVVKRGQALRLINTSGTGGVAALFWNLSDPSERFNAGDTVKLQWTARLSRGRVLFSDMGRVMASIIGDTCGRHDALLGGGGAGAGGRNTRDNFRLAVGKHGLGKRDIAPCMTFFAPVTVAEDGTFGWQDGVVQPGQTIDLRAEMDILVALSNCPHPLSPTSESAGPVDAIVWQAPPAAADDLCRHFGEEAERGFMNTEAAL
jgi:urea carboxylase-associated protein 2